MVVYNNVGSATRYTTVTVSEMLWSCTSESQPLRRTRRRSARAHLGEEVSDGRPAVRVVMLSGVQVVVVHTREAGPALAVLWGGRTLL